jgi:hypothetical protein
MDTLGAVLLMADEPTTTTKPGSDDLDDLREMLAEIRGSLKGGGSAETKLAEALADNFKLRERLREAKKSATPEGSVVLTGDDAKSWKKYRELGEPADVRKALDDGAAAKAEAESFRKAERDRRVAALMGWRPKVFSALAQADGLTIAVEDSEDGEGKAPPTAYVMGEGSKRTPLADYAKSHWGDELAALALDPNQAVPPGPPVYGTPPRERKAGPPPPPGRGTDSELRDDQLRLVQYQPL